MSITLWHWNSVKIVEILLKVKHSILVLLIRTRLIFKCSLDNTSQLILRQTDDHDFQKSGFLCSCVPVMGVQYIFLCSDYWAPRPRTAHFSKCLAKFLAVKVWSVILSTCTALFYLCLDLEFQFFQTRHTCQ